MTSQTLLEMARELLVWYTCSVDLTVNNNVNQLGGFSEMQTLCLFSGAHPIGHHPEPPAGGEGD